MDAKRDLGAPEPLVQAAVQAAMTSVKDRIAELCTPGPDGLVTGASGVLVQVEARLQVALNLLEKAQADADARAKAETKRPQ